jgi:hypothetical protein
MTNPAASRRCTMPALGARDAAVSSSAGGDYKYWAFISYSHRDETWAAWLHTALETYRIPRRLAGVESSGRLPARLFPVFRDRDDLAGAADLSTKIQEALRQSRHMIVICSPHAAVSRWVNEEVRAFKALRREDQVLCLIVDGEPNASDQPDNGLLECFPPAVRFRVGEDGQGPTLRSEPMAADARTGKDGRLAARLKLIAGLLNVGYDELRQRDAQRRRRQRIRIATGGMLLGVLAGVGYVMLADKGAPLPGGAEIRWQLDHQGLTLFRPVRKDAEIREAATRLRQTLVRELWRR